MKILPKKKPTAAALPPPKPGVRTAVRAVPPRAAAVKPAWLMADPRSIRKAEAEADTLSGKNRAPELWVREGETRIIRVRQPDKLGLIWRYTIPSNGRFQSYTAPPQGQPDLFRSRLGLNPSLRALYEVIDRTGYVTRENKKRKDYPCFLVANTQVHKMLEALRDTYGPLNGYDIRLSRSGSGRSTVYTVLPCPPAPLPSALINQPSLAKELVRYYGPPTVEEMEAAVGRLAGGQDDCEDTDPSSD